MSRLLCVVAAMLLVTAALAAPGDVATATGTPQLKTSATPLAATAEFKATVATYASIVVTPPTTLAVTGDISGAPGSGTIEPDLNDDWDAAAAEHGGLVEVSANDKCYLQMQVTEFAGTGEEGVSAPTTEKLKSLVKVGDIMVGLTPSGDLANLDPETFPEYPTTAWRPLGFFAGTEPQVAGFVQVIDEVGGWDGSAEIGAMPYATGGTYVVRNLPIDPLVSDFRYLRLFWGTQAFNRIDADADASHEYETLAAKGDYVATVTATLTADAL